MNEPTQVQSGYPGWQAIVRKYQTPDLRRSLWQIANSFGGLLVLGALMYLALGVGYWLTLLLAVPAAGFLVRIFIIQHDCGHGAFFRSKRANDVVGGLSGVLTATPYNFWRKTHAIHHAHHAELEERGVGDVWTMTVDEYASAPWWKRAGYRVFRHPLFLFGVAPAFNFLLVQRFPLGARASWRTGEKRSVWLTNAAIAVLLTGSSLLIGVVPTFVIGLPVILLAASAGTWLFYVQHQFERTYWEHTPTWDYTLAALHGSSYYSLPRVLQWFSGNIGFHHIHHLSPRIPNYNLERCHRENPTLQRVTKLTLVGSFRTVALALWDEDRRRLVTFREALRGKPAAASA